MDGVLLFALLAACLLAGSVVSSTDGRRVALLGVALTVVGYVVSVLGPWLFVGQRQELFPDDDPVQFGLILLFGLVYAMVAVVLLLPVRRRRWARRAAFVLPVLLCGLGVAIAITEGDMRGQPTGTGMGWLSDLVFLNPMELCEGVSRDGVLTHRYRIHAIALGVILLGALIVVCLYPWRRGPIASDGAEDAEVT